MKVGIKSGISLHRQMQMAATFGEISGQHPLFYLATYAPEVRYRVGVAIRRDGAFGPVYGRGGWIPGYTSSLRYYADHGVAVAFQINTDIGLTNDTPSVVAAVEARLAETVLESEQQSPVSNRPGLMGTV